MAKIKVICEQCSKEFYVYKSRVGKSRFCSHKCYSKWTSDNKSGENSPHYKKRIKLICQQCGKEYFVRSRRKDISHFCSQKCKGEWMSENLRGENSPVWKGGNIISICQYCGEEYYITPTLKDISHFCSYNCRSKWRSENESGKNSSLYKDRIILVCCQCEKEYRVYPYRKDTAKFCSKECMYEWLSEYFKGNKHSEEARQRISASHQDIPYEEWDHFISGEYKPDWRDWSKVIYLNDWFEDCHRHHITQTLVICIPAELHNHINHNLKTGRNMAEINILALQFINGEL